MNDVAKSRKYNVFKLAIHDHRRFDPHKIIFEID
jgi:hypothetical protein